MLPLSALDDANDDFIVRFDGNNDHTAATTVTTMASSSNDSRRYRSLQNQQPEEHPRITSWSDLEAGYSSSSSSSSSGDIVIASRTSDTPRRRASSSSSISINSSLGSAAAHSSRRATYTAVDVGGDNDNNRIVLLGAHSRQSSSSSSRSSGLPPPYTALTTTVPQQPLLRTTTTKSSSKAGRVQRASRFGGGGDGKLSASQQHYIQLPLQDGKHSSRAGTPLGGGRAAGATGNSGTAGSGAAPSYNEHVHPFTFDSQSHNNSDQSWLMSHWNNISNLLKTSPAFRLLAYAVVFFNLLIALRIMADPLDGFHGYSGSSSSGGNDGLTIQDGGANLDAGNVAMGQIRYKDRLFQEMPVVMAASHNDEMQAAPFSEAMSLGFGSIEVDTWLIEGTLLAGHESNDLSRGKTLKQLYLDPLFRMLERANNATSGQRKEASGSNSSGSGIKEKAKGELLGEEKVLDVAAEAILDFERRSEDDDDDNKEESGGEQNEGKHADESPAAYYGPSERIKNWKSDDWKGVYPLAPKQDLMLMIDVKANPNGTFHKLREVLQPFIDRNYLTVYRDGQLIKGPITIVGTGDTPIELVYAANPRYIFYDAPLVRLQHPITIDGKLIEWGPELAPIASSKWLWWNYYPNVEALAGFTEEAHKRGIQARWWGVARWPAYFRRALWNLQLRAGVDWINADDLADVASFLRTRGQPNRKTGTATIT